MKKCLFCLLAMILGASQARSEAPFSPSGIRATVTQMCMGAGITPLPPDFAVPGLAGGRLNLLRTDQSIVGQISYEEQIERGYSRFTVYDTQNHVLAQATQTVTPCPPGRCVDTVFTTMLDAADDKGAPFEVTDSPEGTYYLRYGEAVEPIFWQRDLAGSMAWLQRVLSTSSNAVALRAGNPRQALELGLASDPALAPYLGNLQILGVGDRLVIVGTVPSTPVYSELALRASDFGVTDLEVDIMTP